MLLAVVLLVLLVVSALSVPFLTQFPNVANFTIQSNSTITATCSATGVGPVTVSVQYNRCGNVWICQTTAANTTTWVQRLVNEDNCGEVRCLSSDANGNNISSPVLIYVLQDVNIPINGSCSSVCNFLRINATKNGVVNFTGFQRSHPNMVIYIEANSFNITTIHFDSLNVLVNNFTLDATANVNWNFNGTSLTTNYFHVTATGTYFLSNGGIHSLGDFCVETADFTFVSMSLSSDAGFCFGSCTCPPS